MHRKARVLVFNVISYFWQETANCRPVHVAAKMLLIQAEVSHHHNTIVLFHVAQHTHSYHTCMLAKYNKTTLKPNIIHILCNRHFDLYLFPTNCVKKLSLEIAKDRQHM